MSRPEGASAGRASYLAGIPYPLDAAGVLSELSGEDSFVFLETGLLTPGNERSWLFSKPVGELRLERPGDAERFISSLETALGDGLWAAGWLSYELGYLLEKRLAPCLEGRAPSVPLAWLGLYKGPEVWTHGGGEGGRLGPVPKVAGLLEELGPCTPKERYLSSVARIKDYIARGDTYQVNLTFRERLSFRGAAEELYLAMRARQAVSYAAFVRAEGVEVLSLSPELFLRVEPPWALARPMKGTAKRGRDLEEDERIARALSKDVKNRAENVMIVDLIRNDLGRISEPGSVRVPELFRVERYETLFQMTSLVEARLLPETGAGRLLRALFPSGSVTGAPKIRTMEIIRELEPSPRGVYTGAVGFFAPDGRSVLNVAIRTVQISKGVAELGIGSGITWGSDPEGEYEESRLKARFLLEPPEPFRLLETLCWRPGEGYALLEEHMERLRNSAWYFGFFWREGEVRRALSSFAEGLPRRAHRVRLLLGRDGEIGLEAAPLEPPPQEALVVPVTEGLPPLEDPFLYHKTTRRAAHDEALARARRKGAFDALWVDEEGWVREGAISNVFLETPSGLATPPVRAGCLPGTLRRALLREGRAYERPIRIEELRGGRFYIGNSVRGLIPARLLE